MTKRRGPLPPSVEAYYAEKLKRAAAAEWNRRMEEAMRGQPQPGTVEVITDPSDLRGFDAQPV